MLQGHAVSLTFNVVIHILCVHIVHIATYAHTKFHAPSFNSFKVIKGFRFLADRLTDGRTDRLTHGRTEGKPILPSGVNTGRGLKHMQEWIPLLQMKRQW